MKYASIAPCILLAVLSGCDSKHATRPDPEDSLYLTDSLQAQGTYRITTQVPVNALLLAPAQVAEFITLIKGMRDTPSKSLFAALDAAGLPNLQDLYDVLPGILQDEVDDAIDDYLNGRRKKDTAFAREEDELIANAERTITHFQVLTDLIIDPEDSIPMRHRFRGLGYTFRVGGRDLDFEAIDNPYIMTRLGLFQIDVPIEADFTPSEPSKGRPARYEFPDHAFGLPYGRLMWDALEAQHEETTGKTLREDLGAQIDCDAMGASVANTCVGFACIGNKAKVRVLCEDALDEVLAQTREKFISMGFEALRFREGSVTLARLRTEPDDGAEGPKIATHLRKGLWNLDLDYGSSPRNLSATFAGALAR